MLYDESKIEELQIYVSESLQLMASKTIDAGYDAYTVFATIEDLAKMYKKNIKKEFKKLVADRKKYEEENQETLALLENDATVLESAEATYVVTE